MPTMAEVRLNDGFEEPQLLTIYLSEPDRCRIGCVRRGEATTLCDYYGLSPCPADELRATLRRARRLGRQGVSLAREIEDLVNAWMDAARGFPRGPVDALGKNPFFVHDADAGFCRNQPRLLAEFMARWRGGWLLGTSAQIKRIVPGLRPLSQAAAAARRFHCPSSRS